MSVLLVLAALVVTSLEVSLAVGVVGGGGLVTVVAIAVGAGSVGLVTALSSLMVASDELLTLVVLAVPVLALCSLVVTGYEFLVTLVVVAIGVAVVSSTIVVGSSGVVVVAVVGSGSSSAAIGVVVGITLGVATLVALVVTSNELLISLVVGVASIGVGIVVVGGGVLSLVVVLVALSLVVVVVLALGLVVVVLSALVMGLFLLDEVLLVDINMTNLSFLSAEDGESESVCRESCGSHQSLFPVSFLKYHDHSGQLTATCPKLERETRLS